MFNMPAAMPVIPAMTALSIMVFDRTAGSPPIFDRRRSTVSAGQGMAQMN